MTMENWGRDGVVCGGGDDDGRSSDIRMVMANGVVYTFRYSYETHHMKCLFCYRNFGEFTCNLLSICMCVCAGA